MKVEYDGTRYHGSQYQKNASSVQHELETSAAKFTGHATRVKLAGRTDAGVNAEGQVIVSTGRVGTGFVRINANPNDFTTPYMDIVERTGSGIYDISLKARLGDLSGLSTSLVGEGPGHGLFSENVFLTGKITATSGKIGGWNIASDGLYSDSGEFQVTGSSGKVTASAALFTGGKIGGTELLPEPYPGITLYI